MWAMDILGDGYLSEDIELAPDGRGPLVATLVHRRAARPTRRAILYVHGYNDYFFQAEMGVRWNARGFDFYALDLRRFGRSIRPHLIQAYTDDLREYYEELDEALRRIRYRDGHDVIVLNPHSMGGLVGTLYAHDRRGRGGFDGLILNAPFYDFLETGPGDRAKQAAAAALGWASPEAIVPHGRSELYGWSLSASYGKGGAWMYDRTWKRSGDLPIRAGWVRAIRAAHARVQGGLDIDVPCLVLHSDRTGGGEDWNPSFFETDTVLDVAAIGRWSIGIGRDVRRVAVPGAMHDVLTSSPEVRDIAYREMFAFADDITRLFHAR